MQCFPALARFAVFMTALRQDEEALELFSQYIPKLSNNVQVAALEAIPEAWKFNWTLHRRCRTYMSATKSESHELRTIAYNNLATTLDTHYSYADASERDKVHQILFFLGQNIIPAHVKHAGREGLSSDIKFGAWIALGVLNSSTAPKVERDLFLRSKFQVWSFLLTKCSSANSVSLICQYPSPHMAN